MEGLSLGKFRISRVIAEEKLFIFHTVVRVKHMVLGHGLFMELPDHGVDLVVRVVGIIVAMFMTIQIEIYFVIEDHRHHI